MQDTISFFKRVLKLGEEDPAAGKRELALTAGGARSVRVHGDGDGEAVSPLVFPTLLAPVAGILAP